MSKANQKAMTDKHKEKLKKIEREINQKTKNHADWKIQKDMDRMEKTGYSVEEGLKFVEGELENLENKVREGNK